MSYTTEELVYPALWLGQRVDSFRFDLLDRHLMPIGELMPADESRPNIRASTDSTIMRQLAGLQFVQGELANIDVRSERLQPVCVLQNGVEFPLGVFMFGDHNTVITTMRDEWAPVMYDQAVILDDPLERTVSADIGVDLNSLVETLANEVGIEHLHLDNVAARAAEPIVWPAGRSRYQVMRDIAFKQGCLAPYFDNAGVLTCRRAPDPTIATEDFEYPLDRIVANTLIETDDSYQAPNRYIAIGTGSQNPVVGRYDLPADAPHSFANRGHWVTETVDSPGIETAEQAAFAARAAAVQDTRSWQRASFTSPLDPRMDLFSIVKYSEVLWLEVGFHLDLSSGGDHRHELARLWN